MLGFSNLSCSIVYCSYSFMHIWSKLVKNGNATYNIETHRVDSLADDYSENFIAGNICLNFRERWLEKLEKMEGKKRAIVLLCRLRSYLFQTTILAFSPPLVSSFMPLLSCLSHSVNSKAKT